MHFRKPGVARYVHISTVKTNGNHSIHGDKISIGFFEMNDPLVAGQKRKFEDDHKSDEDTTSDESWSPSSDASSVVEREIHTRSRGRVTAVSGDINDIMDKADEEVNNESDFSSTTEEGEEEDDEESDEEEEDEEDTEDDGYSDDDSFVTSNEDEEESPDEEGGEPDGIESTTEEVQPPQEHDIVE